MLLLAVALVLPGLSAPAPSSLPRGAVAGVAAAPAPPGVCATGRGVAAPPLLVANIVLFRV